MIMATECFERMKPGFESYLLYDNQYFKKLNNKQFPTNTYSPFIHVDISQHIDFFFNN